MIKHAASQAKMPERSESPWSGRGIGERDTSDGATRANVLYIRLRYI